MVALRDDQQQQQTLSLDRNEIPAASLDEEILNWIDGIPLSRKYSVRNFARDFSDAVLVSEILKFYYPNLVASYHYIGASSVQGKRDNWNVLNRKVLTKIDMRLTPEVIEQLSHSQNGVIDKVLHDIREKLMPKVKSIPNITEDVLGTSRQLLLINLKDKKQMKKKSIGKTTSNCFVGLFVGMFKIILGIVCFWKWFSKKSIDSKQVEKTPIQEENDNQIRDAYVKSLNDLEHCYEAIKNLRHKISFLEGTIKLKDAKIAGLQNELNNRANNNNNNIHHLHHSNHHRSGDINSSRLSFDSYRSRSRTQIH